MTEPLRPRSSQPSECTSPDEELSYRVWGYCPRFEEDDQPWKCLAAFSYLLECLDWIAKCQDKGVTVVFQSPHETQLIEAGACRVVYRPEPVAALDQPQEMPF